MPYWTSIRLYLFVVLAMLITQPLFAQSESPADPAAPETESTSDSATEDTGNIENPTETDSEADSGETVADEAALAVEEVSGGSKDSNIQQRTGVINFSGIVKERGSRKPKAYVTIYLKETEFEATTNKSGRFAFKNLPADIYTVVIPTMDYDLFETTEEINDGEAIEVVYYLEPKVVGTLEVVVRGQKVKKEVSRKTLNIEEAKVIPGSQGDAVKVVQNLPGVSSVIAGGGLVIRGSNAEDSRIMLDGHEIPLLFHFGGYKSVYNSDLLDQIDLYTGGFGTKFQNATGGIVELQSRKPRDDRWGGYFDTSLLDITALAEGPVNDKGSFAFAFRRSVIDLWLAPFLGAFTDDLEFTALPVYYDYQAKFHYQLDKLNSISIDAHGSLDKLELVSNLVSDTEPEFTGDLGFQTQAHSLVLHYRHITPNFESDFTPGLSYVKLSAKVGNDYFFDLDAVRFDIYEHMLFRINKTNTLAFGIQFEPSIGTARSNLVRPPKEGDVSYSFSNSDKVSSDMTESDLLAGFYVNDTIEYKGLTIIPGLRFDYYSTLETYAISPSLIARYKVLDPLVIKASIGLYHRKPDFDEVYEPYGNKGLEFERALHVVAGLEWQITDTLSLDIQGYYKKLDNLVSSINEVDEDNPNLIYDNGGKGYVYGGEVLLRHDFSNNFFGWISYSIAQAKRTDGPGTSYRYFDLDQTHNLVVVASYGFLKTWRIGARFQYSSGTPYTEILGNILNADNGTYLPLFDSGNKNNKRTGASHQLDLRLDKSFIYNTWILKLYFDIQNAYFHNNPIATVYNYDYTESDEIKGLPFLMSIGLRAEF